jgi:hypothetical protein
MPFLEKCFFNKHTMEIILKISKLKRPIKRLIMKTLLSTLFILPLFIFSSTKAQSPNCEDLGGLDFGACLAVLGYGMVDGECTTISGCSAIIEDVDYSDFIFDTPEQCEAACNYRCLNMIFLDFGPCEAIIGYGMINGECTAISGCSTIINGYDFAPYLYSTPQACQLACNPICMDLYGVDFGPCDLFMGYAWINGEVIALSGCGSIVDGVDYADFIYDSEDDCELFCENACLDLATLDFGECAMPLGIGIINGECTMLSGCSYEVNGVDYEDYFFFSMDDCESSCIAVFDDCVVPEIIDSTSACYEIFEPVCGCDGVTYNNDCYARTYGGVLYWTEGSCTTGIQQINKSTLRIYPNPAENLLTIENPESEVFSVQLYELSGKLILQFNLYSSHTIDISYINQGIYLLYLINNDGDQYVEKLLIK